MEKWIVVLGLMCFTGTAFGQRGVGQVKTPGPLVVADQFFRDGVFDKALIEYQKAFESTHDPAIYYNIAQCLHRMDHCDKAILYYELFLSKNPAGPLVSHVQKHITVCENRLQDEKRHKDTQPVSGVRRIAVVSEPPGAEVFVNTFTGNPAGITPLMLELDTTAHLVVLKKDGYRDASRLVDVGMPGLTLLRFPLEPLISPVHVEPSEQKAEPPVGVGTLPVTMHPPVGLTGQWWFWTGLAATSVLTLSGILTGIRAVDLKKEYDHKPGAVLKDRVELWATWTDVLLGSAVISGVITGLASYWFLKEQGSGGHRSLTVLPACGGDTCGVSFFLKY